MHNLSLHNLSFDKLSLNWFDAAVVVVLLLGARKGRQQGLSLELLPMFQWLVILAACTFGYKPLGDALAQSSPFSHLSSYLAAYVGIAIVIKIFFSAISHALGGKLIGSDVFGVGEFYIGILAGMARYGCVLVAALALLNARLYTAQEVAAKVAFQNDMYGSTFFPELNNVQQQVFEASVVGKLIKKKAGILLIKPTAPENKALGGGTSPELP